MVSKTTVIIVGLIALFGFGMSVFFGLQLKTSSQKLTETKQQLDQMKEANSEQEKELIYFRNADLAKEVELLKVKLSSTEKDLTASQKEAVALNTRVQQYQNAVSKTDAYLDAVNAIENIVQDRGPTASSVAAADQAVSRLNDTQVLSKWQQAEDNIDLANGSWNSISLADTVKTIMEKVRQLLSVR